MIRLVSIVAALTLVASADALSVWSQTFATAPSDRGRRVVGMGETVYLEVRDATGTATSGWCATSSSTANGASVLDTSGGAGSSFQFNAPLAAAGITIVVEFTRGVARREARFICVPPAGIEILDKPTAQAPWRRGEGWIAAVDVYPVRFQPATVNFYNLTAYEKRTQSLPDRTSFPGTWTPTPVPPPRVPGVLRNPCDYPTVLPYDPPWPLDPTNQQMLDLVGVPALNPASCITDNAGMPETYPFSFGFDNVFLDWSNSENQFEVHLINITWKDTYKTRTALSYAFSTSTEVGEDQGAWQR